MSDNNEYWLVYNLSDGAERWRGKGPIGQFEIEQEEPPEGGGLLLIPKEAIGDTLDMDIVKAFYHRHIDSQAEAVRNLFITPGSGQALTYMRKEAEARAYVADNNAATPVLVAEATARSMTVAALAAEVIAAADLWAIVGSQIEGLRS